MNWKFNPHNEMKWTSGFTNENVRIKILQQVSRTWQLNKIPWIPPKLLMQVKIIKEGNAKLLVVGGQIPHRNLLREFCNDACTASRV